MRAMPKHLQHSLINRGAGTCARVKGRLTIPGETLPAGPGGVNRVDRRAAPFPLSLFPLVFFRLPIFVSRVKSFEPCNPVRF
jgi:hypothetical protein